MVRPTDRREFGNVNSLAAIEFTLKNEHYFARLTRLLENYCYMPFLKSSLIAVVSLLKSSDCVFK